MPKTKNNFILSKYIKYFLIIISITILTSCLSKDKKTNKSARNNNIEIINTFELVLKGDHQNEGHCFDLKFSIDSDGKNKCHNSSIGRCIGSQFFSEDSCLANPELNLKWENGNCFSPDNQTKSKCEAEGYCEILSLENKQDCLINKFEWKDNTCIDSKILSSGNCISDINIIKKWISLYSWSHSWVAKEELSWANEKCENNTYKNKETCRSKGFCSNLVIKSNSQCLTENKKCISKLYKDRDQCMKHNYKWEEQRCINPTKNTSKLCNEDNDFYWGPYDWVNNTYGNQELFYGPIVGKVNSKSISAPVKIKWETIVDDKVVYSGYGGWVSSKWPHNHFEGIWSINRIKLVDSVINKIIIKVYDESGNYKQTDVRIKVDASPPIITIFNPLPDTQAEIFWTNESKVIVKGHSVDNVQNQELIIFNRSIDDLNQEVYNYSEHNSQKVDKIINIESKDDKEVKIDLLPLVNFIEVVGIDSSKNQSNKLIKVGYDPHLPTLSLKYPTSETGSYQSRVATRLSENITIRGEVTDVGSGVDYIAWKNINTNQEGVIHTIGEWEIEDIHTKEGINKIEIIAIDKVGNHSSKSTHLHIFDNTSPEVHEMNLVDDKPTTKIRNIGIKINAEDQHSEIKSVCLKNNDNTQPVEGDLCWNNAISTTDNTILIFHQLGISSIKYKVYAWVKDEAGNISTLGNNGNGKLQKDFIEITFIPGELPIINKVIATTTNIPSTPPTHTEKTYIEGDSIYIKWSVEDAEGLSDLPISIYYKTHDKLELIETKLQNTININQNDYSGAPCSIDSEFSIYGSGFTGCFKWTSSNIPTEYFTIIIEVEDLTGQTVKMSSVPINTGKLGFIAGNNILTIEASAMNSIFIKSKSLEQGLFTISSDSTLLFRDYHRGIIKVDPSNGLTKLLVPIDSSKPSNSGDGWLIKYATLKNPTKIDENNNSIYIYDTDRIRVIEEFNNNQKAIRTLIGGGESTLNTIQNPLDLKITTISLDEYKNSRVNDERVFIVLPNGDIIFSSEQQHNRKPISNDPNSFRLRYYSKENNNITSIIPHGTNTLGKDIKECIIKTVDISYNPTTSEITKMFFTVNSDTINCGDYFIDPKTGEIINSYDASKAKISYLGETFPHTGKNGVMYRVNYYRKYIQYFDSDLGSWEFFRIKTPIEEIFISKTGRLYYYNLGKIKYLRQDQINIPDKEQCLAANYTFSNNNCIDESLETLYGSGYHINDGGIPTTANFNNISSFSVVEDHDSIEIFALDAGLNKYVKMIPGVKNIHLAGNGIKVPWISTDVDARKQGTWVSGWTASSFTRFFIYNNKLYVTMRSRSDYELTSLNMSTFMWEKEWSWDKFDEEKPHTYINDPSGISEGMNANDNIRLPEYSFIAGFNPVHEKALIWSYYSISQINLKQNFQISPLTSYDLTTSKCTTNSALPLCKVTSSRIQITDFNYINFPSKKGWVTGFKNYSTDLFLYEPNNYISKIATLPNSYLSFFYKYNETGHSKVFYCSDSGNLHKYNINTEVDSQLNLLNGDLKCSGQTIYYSERRKSLMFPYQQNSLSGIAEYDISDE